MSRGGRGCRLGTPGWYILCLRIANRGLYHRFDGLERFPYTPPPIVYGARRRQENSRMSFQCTVVTPEQQVLDETVTQCILPAHDGQIGILRNRAPLLVKLGIGPLRVDVAQGQRRSFFVDGGIAQMKGNRLTILTDNATPMSEIDAEA